jgi:hypothetical protein
MTEAGPRLTGGRWPKPRMRLDQAVHGVAQCAVIEDVEENMRPPGRRPGRPRGGVSDQSQFVTGRGFIGIADGIVEFGRIRKPCGYTGHPV